MSRCLPSDGGSGGGRVQAVAVVAAAVVAVVRPAAAFVIVRKKTSSTPRSQYIFEQLCTVRPPPIHFNPAASRQPPAASSRQQPAASPNRRHLTPRPPRLEDSGASAAAQPSEQPSFSLRQIPARGTAQGSQQAVGSLRGGAEGGLRGRRLLSGCLGRIVERVVQHLDELRRRVGSK